ncbi:MAG: TonB-dependent receptor [Aureispira sp.]
MNHLFSAFLFLLPILSSAQSITGKILDKDKYPIGEVQVLNLSSSHHAHSNEYGEFTIQQSAIGDTLKLYHMGYQVVEVIIDKNPMIITLQDQLLDLEEILILPQKNTLNLISTIDSRVTPVNSSQDILRRVPGLFIGQHAGGGKAEQIFLRGFDVDHGTDITLTVDGLPVNMVSHAHGQGYADLHFVIPETVDKIDFGKGPYYANHGNFNTAGYVDFKTKNRVDNSLLRLELGQFNTLRTLGLFNLLDKEEHQAYVALEYTNTDGAFESPQNFNRLNLFAKYTGSISATDKVSATFSHFTSKWDASGQIPQRAIDNGNISRFGAIDDTEGGNTSRTNALIHYNKFLSDHSSIKSNLYYTKYDFQLYSNFTFFLEDSINGDQIQQHEDRTIIGLQSAYHHHVQWQRVEGKFVLGFQLRHDQINDNELSHTLNRQTTLQQFQYGQVHESNLAAFANTSFDLGKWSLEAGVRVDYFDFQYNDQLQGLYQTQSANKILVSPKLNLAYTHSQRFQAYVKAGQGFHSNDTRVVVAQKGRQILPAAYGVDLGIFWKPFPRFLVNMAYWYLFLEQEFVYVGDAGIVEPSGKTQRQGGELSLRYQTFDWLFWTLDANYTYARATEEALGENFIPLAPDLTLTSGLQVIHPSGIYGGLHLRFLKDRPANEDNSIVAKGYTIVDFNAGFRFKRFDLGFKIENLFNTDWKETQFATTSRLQGETSPVEEIHFTPGTPFFLKGIIQYSF